VDVGALRASPIGQLVPISGTDWQTGGSYPYFAYVPDPLPDVVALANATWTAVGIAGDKLERLNRTARKLGRAAGPRDTVASLFEHGAAAAPALHWARGEPLTVGLVHALQAALVHGARATGAMRAGCAEGTVSSAVRPARSSARDSYRPRTVPASRAHLRTGSSG
jgi:hypothetical protein